ncbi:MAG: hypothetical protein IK005_02125 [Paludibacteraceae bacterium]|nr:hypothetical protein [Paludibacteraceae bacterium]
MKRLYQIFILTFLSIFAVSANDRPQIVKTNAKGQEKTSFELLTEIKGIVDTLEEKDSLLRFSYMDYCLDSILFQSKEKYKRLYLAQQMCEDSFFYFFSSKQKALYLETILKERYYYLCFWNLDMRWGPDSSCETDCICRLLMDNGSDEILNSVRNARDELTQMQCEECTKLDHKLFYRQLLLGLHDNSQIDSLFQNMITASNSKKEMEISNVFIPKTLSVGWFYYRKEDMFDTFCSVIRNNKNAYFRYELQSSEDPNSIIWYESLDYCLMSWLLYTVVDFPYPEKGDNIRLKFKKDEYYTYSDGYKQRVVKWMKEHRSDYVIREE